MRILFILGTFPSVSKTFILNQIKGLIDEGHEVQVLALRDGQQEIEHDLVQQYNLESRTTYVNPPGSNTEALKCLIDSSLGIFRKDGFTVEPVRRFLKDGKYAPMNIATLEKFMELGDFDVVHYHFGTRAKKAIFMQRFSEARSVTSFYGYDVSQAPKNEHFNGYSEVFQESDTITALSQDMSSKLQNLGCPSQKIEKVPLCIDTSKFKPKETENKIPKILTVARFTEKKGLKYALNALSQIEQEFEYHMVGDGELREQIEKQVKKQGLEDQVTFLGWMTNEEVKEKMQESDIFLLPSVTASNGDEEGTPTVLLEAQATGLPVVSTYHAGIPEIVQDGETGLLAQERDVKNLSYNIRRLLGNEDLREEFGKAGRSYIEQNHSIEKIAQRLESIYAS